MEKLFVTRSHYDKLSDKIARLADQLAFIISEQAHAWENCGDGWHDNPYYSHLMAQEKICMKQLEDLRSQISCSVVTESDTGGAEERDCIAICTRVVIKELNVRMNTERVREISVVPIGAEDTAAGAISYNSPYARAILGARVGDVIEIKLPSGEFEVTVIEIRGKK